MHRQRLPGKGYAIASRCSKNFYLKSLRYVMNFNVI